MHASHDHVMAYTHYFQNPVNSEEFERFVKELPRDVYRAKGIVTFTDTSSRFLFQYAYREADFMRITPQGEVPDVAVFIGEHFSSGEPAQGASAPGETSADQTRSGQTKPIVNHLQFLMNGSFLFLQVNT